MSTAQRQRLSLGQRVKYNGKKGHRAPLLGRLKTGVVYTVVEIDPGVYVDLLNVAKGDGSKLAITPMFPSIYFEAVDEQ